MNEYRQLQRVKRRGGRCVMSFFDEKTKVSRSALCGCGSRDPIDKKDNNRIVRRELKKSLDNLIENEYNQPLE